MSSAETICWERGRFGGAPMPIWTPRIDITAVARVARRLLGLSPDECTVSFLSKGAFNRLYRIETKLDSYVLRISIPLEMPHKIQSEVDTMRWVRTQTAIPIPTVHWYATDDDNEIGYPWILMDYVAGASMRAKWIDMTPEQKRRLMTQLAACQSELFSRPFDTLGSLYANRSLPARIDTEGKSLSRGTVSEAHRMTYEPGRYVGPDSLTLTPACPRGPFKSPLEWTTTRLQDVQRACVDNSEMCLEEPEVFLGYTDELRDFAEALAAYSDLEPQFALHLHDLHADNILLDDDCALAAIVDWEFMSTAPMWQAAQFPKFCQVNRIPRPQTRAHDGSANPYYECDLYTFEMFKTYRPIYEEELCARHPDWSMLHDMFLETELEEEMDRALAGEGADEESARWLGSVWNVVASRELPLHCEWSRFDPPDPDFEILYDSDDDPRPYCLPLILHDS